MDSDEPSDAPTFAMQLLQMEATQAVPADYDRSPTRCVL